MTARISGSGTVGTEAATDVSGVSMGVAVAQPASAPSAISRNGRNMGDLVMGGDWPQG